MNNYTFLRGDCVSRFLYKLPAVKLATTIALGFPGKKVCLPDVLREIPGLGGIPGCTPVILFAGMPEDFEEVMWDQVKTFTLLPYRDKVRKA